MTTSNIIERSEDTLSKSYLKCRKNILRWRANNKEHLAKYNREYQRKLRADPVRMQELTMRVNTRAYLGGLWKNSYKVISAIGMDRAQLAAKHNMNEEQLKEMLKTHEIDHIVSTSWFNKPDHKHLKPYMYRHYNIQFVPKSTNRTKHSYVDENDPRIQLVITQLELDYQNSKNQYTKSDMEKVAVLANKASKLRTKIKNKY